MNGNIDYTRHDPRRWQRPRFAGTAAAIGSVCGGILVADTVELGNRRQLDCQSGWSDSSYYEHNGGGDTLTGTCTKASMSTFRRRHRMPFARIAFQQLRRVP